jgi:hypothetical protein
MRHTPPKRHGARFGCCGTPATGQALVIGERQPGPVDLAPCRKRVATRGLGPRPQLVVILAGKLRGFAIRLAKRTGEDTLPRAVWGRGAIITAVLALWIAMAVAWGWAARMAFAFVVAIALARVAGVILGGTLIQPTGRSYYERQLRRRRRAP